MSKNDTIDAVELMRAARDRLSADMKGMTAQERLDYIRRAARGRKVARTKARPGRTRPQPAHV